MEFFGNYRGVYCYDFNFKYFYTCFFIYFFYHNCNNYRHSSAYVKRQRAGGEVRTSQA